MLRGKYGPNCTLSIESVNETFLDVIELSFFSEDKEEGGRVGNNRKRGKRKVNL